MDDAEIIDRVDDYWGVVSRGRRYFLRDSQISNKQHPHVGQRGLLGYVQRPASKMLMFTDSEAPL
ncbi:MAG: hypothetical protein H7Y60_04025 [Rhodospirillaceae bacterium]|nr:hypothetical protein [Rhodospirillales bacterium]